MAKQQGIRQTKQKMKQTPKFFLLFFVQNKHTICGHLMTPYILVIKNFMTPLFFFPKIYDPQYIWDPLQKKMPAPLYWSVSAHD